MVVSSEEIGAYTGMIEAHAARFTRLPEMENEFDDFCQMGRLAVWDALQIREHPSNLVVSHAMSKWARLRRRQLHGQEPLPEDDPS